ncbi:uncharacterized protein PG986_014234 [Apiospora aurea]|uniref:Uncharacterized protein n=1 Tax=Apiospora aurea TaxID=335848 RepID=A0ABR1PSE9_9PEZI
MSIRARTLGWSTQRTILLRSRIPPLTQGRCGPIQLQRQRRHLATSARDAADQMTRTFADRTMTRRQVLDGNQLQKLSLTLGRPHLHSGLDVSETPPPDGTPLPPGYHLVYFTPGGLESELGPDGTDRTFNAPAPFTRRMWAGGHMTWTPPPAQPLRVGQRAEERTRLLSATPKKSRDGGGDGPRRGGEGVLGARGAGAGGSAVLDLSAGGAGCACGGFSGGAGYYCAGSFDGGRPYPYRQLRWSPVGLFRLSALTFNGHKIHYDGSWTRSVEDHPGCVVHGPLNLISMLDYWRDVCGEGPVGGITYRAMSPLYAGDTYRISAQKPVQSDDGKSWEVLVQNGELVCMKGTITA